MPHRWTMALAALLVLALAATAPAVSTSPAGAAQEAAAPDGLPAAALLSAPAPAALAASVAQPTGANGRGDPIVGRFNADPYPDKAYLGLVGTNRCSVIVYPGTADGSFGFPSAYVYLRPGSEGGELVNCPDIGVAIDLQNNGIDDLAVSWFAGPPRTISYTLLVLTELTYQPAYSLEETINQPSWQGTQDFNGDGRDDVYMVTDQGRGYETYLNNADGRLTPGPERWCATPNRIMLKDLSANRATDALISYFMACADRSSGVVVVLDTGAARQLERDPYGLTTWTVSVVYANADRAPDVRTVNNQTGVVRTFINTGTGEFVLAPRAIADRATVPGNRSTAINVLANDYASGDAKVSIVRPPRYGTVRLTSSRTVVYTPRSRHGRTDSFVYRLTENGRTSDIWVSLRIDG